MTPNELDNQFYETIMKVPGVEDGFLTWSAREDATKYRQPLEKQGMTNLCCLALTSFEGIGFFGRLTGPRYGGYKWHMTFEDQADLKDGTLWVGLYVTETDKDLIINERLGIVKRIEELLSHVAFASWLHDDAEAWRVRECTELFKEMCNEVRSASAETLLTSDKEHHREFGSLITDWEKLYG